MPGFLTPVIHNDRLQEPTPVTLVSGGIEVGGQGAASSTPLAGSATTTSVVGPFTPELGRPINLMLDFTTGSFVGTVTAKRSTDGGTTKRGVTVAGTAWAVFTSNCNEPFWEETEDGAAFYLDIVRTSGTLAWAFTQ